MNVIEDEERQLLEQLELIRQKKQLNKKIGDAKNIRQKRMNELKEKKLKICEEILWIEEEEKAITSATDTEIVMNEIKKMKRVNTPRVKCDVSDKMEEVKEKDIKKKKQIRSVISRDVDTTFARCDTITITEKYKKQTASLFLVRTRGETNWKRGAWKDEDGIAYTTPNVAWKALIERTWGEEGPRQSNVWAKEGRLIAKRNGFPVVDIYKYPFSVIMNLDECCGSYFGRNFSELSEADFRQI